MLSREDILETLTRFLEELFEVPPDRVRLEAKLYEELELDSIDAVDLVVKLQELTGRRIRPEEFKNARTVGDVVDCVHNLLLADEGAAAQ